MSPQARRGLLAAVFVLAAAAVLVWLLWPDDGAAPRGGAAEPAAAEPGAGAPGGTGGSGPAPPPDLAPGRERLQQALDDYRRVAVYPPWSRPHEEGTAYKLAWNEPVVSDLVFLEAGDRVLKFRFAADRAHVAFGEALTSWIEVWEASAPDRRLPATIGQAWVMSLSGGRQGRTVALGYADDGSHRYTNRFVPSEHEELADAQQVRITAEVEVDGERRLITRDFTYTPRPVLEVLAIRDAVRDGSLVITLDVEVFEPGLHTIEANALSGDGELPIAYVDTSSTLAIGKTSVELVFFGKIFRDLAIDGPYQIRDLRGFRRDLDGGENLYWSDPRRHTTRPYPRTDLSDAPWDSDEKREKIRSFEQLIEQAR
jgi:hypothetical protein